MGQENKYVSTLVTPVQPSKDKFRMPRARASKLCSVSSVLATKWATMMLTLRIMLVLSVKFAALGPDAIEVWNET